MTVREAAPMIGVKPSTVLRYCERGMIGRLVGRVWMLDQGDVRAAKEWRQSHPPGRKPRDR